MIVIRTLLDHFVLRANKNGKEIVFERDASKERLLKEMESCRVVKERLTLAHFEVRTLGGIWEKSLYQELCSRPT